MKKNIISCILISILVLLSVPDVTKAQQNYSEQREEVHTTNYFSKKGKLSIGQEYADIRIQEENTIHIMSQGNKSIYTVKVNSNIVSSKNQLVKQLRDAMLNRKNDFSIVYEGSYKDIINNNNWEELYELAWKIDDISTSDDFDYLKGVVSYYDVTIPAYNNNKTVFWFHIDYLETNVQTEKVNDTIKSALQSLQLEGMTDLEKTMAIHNYIINLIDYDTTLTHYSAYDGLVSNLHTTVCQGYALIIYKMLTEAGVSCRYVTGFSGEEHAWNLVKIGDKWYYLDATWDDPISKTPVIVYDYFLVGSNTLANDHLLDREFQDSTFLSSYPISSTDYDWKTELSKSNKVKLPNWTKEKEVSQVTIGERTRQQILADIDRQYSDSNNEYDKMLGKLYKKIFSSILAEIPDKAFDQMMINRDDRILWDWSYYLVMEQVEQKILIPLDQYSYSRKIENQIMDQMLEDYSKTELYRMTDKELYNKIVLYEEDLIIKKFQKLSQKYSDEIIEYVLKELKDRISFIG